MFCPFGKRTSNLLVSMLEAIFSPPPKKKKKNFLKSTEVQKVWGLPVYWLHNSWPGILREVGSWTRSCHVVFVMIFLVFFPVILWDLQIQYDSTDEKPCNKKQVTMEKQCLPMNFLCRGWDWNPKKRMFIIDCKNATEHKRSVSVVCIMILLSFFYHGLMPIFLLPFTTKWTTTTYK